MRYFKLLFSGAVVLALSTVCSAGISDSANVITNGGFETGDFTGWTTGGDLSMYWNLEVTNQAPHSGTDAAHFGAYGNLGPATLSQTFATTPGSYYAVTFYYCEYNQNSPLGEWGYLNPDNISTDPNSLYYQANELDVYWDNSGSPSFSATNFFTSNQPASATDPDGGISQGDYFYQEETFLVQADSSSSTLTFAAFDRQQDVILDDISVVDPPAPVPEPGSFAGVAGLLAFVGVALRRKQQEA